MQDAPALSRRPSPGRLLGATLEEIKRDEREDHDRYRNSEQAGGQAGTPAISRGKENETGRNEGDHRKLEAVRRRPFVGRRRMPESAKDGEEGDQGKDDEGDGADAIQELGSHRLHRGRPSSIAADFARQS